jgi:hypothetical protein
MYDSNDTGLSITPEYKDIVCLDEPIENSNYSGNWGHFTEFTRESVELLEEYENDTYFENDAEYYIIKGEFLENGEFTYDKPILSIDYYLLK